jgi:sRNA-binding protein
VPDGALADTKEEHVDIGGTPQGVRKVEEEGHAKSKEEEKKDSFKEEKPKEVEQPKEKKKKQYKTDEDLLLAFRFFDKNGVYFCAMFHGACVVQ